MLKLESLTQIKILLTREVGELKYAQDLVADQVAVDVVDALEVVDVDHAQPQAGIGLETALPGRIGQDRFHRRLGGRGQPPAPSSLRPVSDRPQVPQYPQMPAAATSPYDSATLPVMLR